MRKGQFTAAQDAHLKSYLEEMNKELAAGTRGVALTHWKQSTAARALEAPELHDLDFSTHPKATWFKLIVRRFTNYYNNVWKKSHPEEPSAASLIKNNPLLKFATILSGRQTFARDQHDTILSLSAQRVVDTSINEAAAYQIVLKEMWDALSPEEKCEWDSQAEDEASDIQLNQKDFVANLHLALHSLCKGGLLGDAEMVLFYGFRDANNGDLVAGTIHGHSKHNKDNFGGNDLEKDFGIPWTKFADSVIPHTTLLNPALAAVTNDGAVLFPTIDLEHMPVVDIRMVLVDYLQKCWIHRMSGHLGELPIPWADIEANPSEFYDGKVLDLPLPLKDPLGMDTVETLTFARFLSVNRLSRPFYFKDTEPEATEGEIPKSPIPPKSPIQILPKSPTPVASTPPPSPPPSPPIPPKSPTPVTSTPAPSPPPSPPTPLPPARDKKRKR
ncbi:hypothetical protein R3P38DRAFT_2507510 [Favolaschia claudopus]|uniref:Uncharacterized protein n=1 Tax=Favolaschia claudopus TaxID=2862362 RepID=A0AAW0D5D9_9AGAR